MNPILLSPGDVAIAAVLIVARRRAVGLALRLGLHRQLCWAALRMVVQLVGGRLRPAHGVRMASPLLTLAVVLVMVAIAGREAAARPEQRLVRFGNYTVGASAVALATLLTATLALTTAIRPYPWYDPHYAIPLAGIVLGSGTERRKPGAGLDAGWGGARARCDRGATRARRAFLSGNPRPAAHFGKARAAADRQPDDQSPASLRYPAS